MNRYEVTSIQGLIQQLVIYLRNGYWFYVWGEVPEGKDPLEVDRKMVMKYSVSLSKWQKARRRKKGFYSTQYIRFGRRWILLATHGTHPLDELRKPSEKSFYVAERKSIKDARRAPLCVLGYALSYRLGRDGKYHVQVRMEEARYREIRDYLVGMATRRKADWLMNAIWNLPFEPYKPVRKQMNAILWKVNEAREKAGYRRIPGSIIPYQRKIVKPYEPIEEAA